MLKCVLTQMKDSFGAVMLVSLIEALWAPSKIYTHETIFNIFFPVCLYMLCFIFLSHLPHLLFCIFQFYFISFCFLSQLHHSNFYLIFYVYQNFVVISFALLDLLHQFESDAKRVSLPSTCLNLRGHDVIVSYVGLPEIGPMVSVYYFCLYTCLLTFLIMSCIAMWWKRCVITEMTTTTIHETASVLMRCRP